MYIANKYWNNYIGDTDDSLTLVEYLASKNKKEICLKEIFSDIGLDRLNGNFRQNKEALTVTLNNIEETDCCVSVEFYYAINVIIDIAALLLECKVNGSVDLRELLDYDLETDLPNICIIATQEEYEIINKALRDFIFEPHAYNIIGIEGETLETAKICKKLIEELY